MYPNTSRLVSEHAFPAAVEDAHDAVVWLSESAAVLGINPDRLGSAGVRAAYRNSPYLVDGFASWAGLVPPARRTDRHGPRIEIAGRT